MKAVAKSGLSAQTSERLLRQAIGIAHHYGFRPIDELARQKMAEGITSAPAHTLPVPHLDIDPFSEEARRVFGMLASRGHLPPREPLFIFWQPRSSKSPLAFGVIGSPLSIAEALLLKVGTILAQEARKGGQLSVTIGSMGDRESAARTERESLSVIRKHEHTLPRELRLLMRDNAFRAIRAIHDNHPEIGARLPSPMDFLSDKSRQHFREVLLHLETADIPYVMHESLVGHPDWHAETMFEIHGTAEDGDTDTKELLARGARYDEYVRRMMKTRTHGVLMFFLGKAAKVKPSFPRKKPPFAFFIHIGFEARQIGVNLLESLRELHVPVAHALGTGGFREQLIKAEETKSPYAIIMGQKEAHDKVVIVRDMMTREQDYIPIPDLPKKLAQLAARKRR